MQAIITQCPFEDTDILAGYADLAMAEYEPLIQEGIQNIQNAGLKQQMDALDDLYIAAIANVQNEMVRNIVCSNCSNKSECDAGRGTC